MELNFIKYHGTGNDFIILDQIKGEILELTQVQIEHLCHRHFGIGADGLIIIRRHKSSDFEMVYFNSDGRKNSMCGNGGRCIVHFAYKSGYISNHCTFTAIDGLHEAWVREDGLIHLALDDVESIEEDEADFVLDTGSPHYVRVLDAIPEQKEFTEMAKGIRYNTRYTEKGINVNAYVERSDCEIEGITYERGVEDITLSCGTGVTAMALVYAKINDKEGLNTVLVSNLGGDLKVEYKKEGNRFSEIKLIGPAKEVFRGLFQLD